MLSHCNHKRANIDLSNLLLSDKYERNYHDLDPSLCSKCLDDLSAAGCHTFSSLFPNYGKWHHQWQSQCTLEHSPSILLFPQHTIRLRIFRYRNNSVINPLGKWQKLKMPEHCFLRGLPKAKILSKCNVSLQSIFWWNPATLPTVTAVTVALPYAFREGFVKEHCYHLAPP